MSTIDDEVWALRDQREVWGSTKQYNPSRRHMLRFGLGAAAGLGVAGAAGIGLMELARPTPGRAAVASPLAHASSPPDRIPRPVPAAPTSSSTARPRPRPVVAKRPLPAWAQRWSAPIYSINDFLARSPSTPIAHNAIMLTVDDGPDPQWTPRYLELFAQHNVRATFFMIGQAAHANPDLVRAVHSAGHVIGNHTYTHDEALPTRTHTRIEEQLRTTSAAIEDACGVTPRQFRAPGGVWGPRVYEVLAELRMMPIAWDIDPRDWSRPGSIAIARTMLGAGRHDIILCHDGGGDRSQTYAALQVVIPRLKQRGYEFVTLPSPNSL